MSLKHLSSEMALKRTNSIISFREITSRNIELLADVLKGVKIDSKPEFVSGVTLETKQKLHSQPVIYQQLGVAVARLNEDQRRKLLSDERVEAITPNLLWTLPEVPELDRPLLTLASREGPLSQKPGTHS